MFLIMDSEYMPKYTPDSYIPIQNRRKAIHPRFRGNKNVMSFPNSSERLKRQNSVNKSDTSDEIPWKKSQSHLYTCGVVGLHEEILDFYEAMRPTEKETEIRLRVIEHITRTVHSLWPQAQVEVFGSFRTGLFLPSSDIDMVIIGEWTSLPLSTLSKALERSGVLNSDITVIANATVPIIRLLHTPSRIKVDISFNKGNGVKAAKLVKSLMKQYPPLSKLVLVLKQFLAQRGLNEVYNGGMSSYCLTLLIVSFLQGYHKPKSESSNLGTLLIEFFELYGINFNYEKVSIHFQDGGSYQPKFRTVGMNLTVEDPTTEGNDVAKGTYLMPQLKQSFQNAFYVLHKAVTESVTLQKPSTSFLQLILKVDDDVLNGRRWILENHSKILKSLSSICNISDLPDRDFNSHVTYNEITGNLKVQRQLRS